MSPLFDKTFKCASNMDVTCSQTSSQEGGGATSVPHRTCLCCVVVLRPSPSTASRSTSTPTTTTFSAQRPDHGMPNHHPRNALNNCVVELDATCPQQLNLLRGQPATLQSCPIRGSPRLLDNITQCKQLLPQRCLAFLIGCFHHNTYRHTD